MRVYVNKHLSLESDEFQWRFTTSGGPGGQHANRNRTRAELTFNIQTSEALPAQIRERLMTKLGTSIVVAVDETRSQHRNKELAVERLIEKLQQALVKQKKRRPTKPTKGSKTRNAKDKKHKSQVKQNRKRIQGNDY